MGILPQHPTDYSPHRQACEGCDCLPTSGIRLTIIRRGGSGQAVRLCTDCAYRVAEHETEFIRRRLDTLLGVAS